MVAAVVVPWLHGCPLVAVMSAEDSGVGGQQEYSERALTWFRFPDSFSDTPFSNWDGNMVSVGYAASSPSCLFLPG